MNINIETVATDSTKTRAVSDNKSTMLAHRLEFRETLEDLTKLESAPADCDISEHPVKRGQSVTPVDPLVSDGEIPLIVASESDVSYNEALSLEDERTLLMVQDGYKFSGVNADSFSAPTGKAPVESSASMFARLAEDFVSQKSPSLDIQRTSVLNVTATQAHAPTESTQPERPLNPGISIITSGSTGAESPAGRGAGSMSTIEMNAREPQIFASRVATHLRVIKSQGGGEAKVNLHPAELGRMSISVITEGSETKVAFTVETAQAKQAIESNLPRLREMLEQAGLSLADSDVAEQNHQSSADTGSEDRSPRSVDTDDATNPELILSVSIDPSRLLDTYV